jgi:phosphoribosylanthranilate isomerase
MKDQIKIKVCGMRDPENTELLCSLGPDYLGFIFYPESKRYVGDRPDPQLFDLVPPGIKKVGVFVNEQLDRIIKRFEEHRLDLVQLHGNESPEFCRKLTDAGVALIKALAPDSSLLDYSGVVQFFLFDTPSPTWGGTGKKFDWKLLEGRSIPVPFLMSGGIGPRDVEAIGQIRQENFVGVDVNSRFELSPGLKDIGQLERFMKELSL